MARKKYKVKDWKIRFWDKVYKTRECWEWQGAKFTNGYGQFRLNGTMVAAHRVSYHLNNLNFPIENKSLKKSLDHLCRNKSCVNPFHLEVISIRENVKRGSLGELNPKKTSKYIGVGKVKNRWRARIFQDGKLKHLGYFNTEKEAAKAYNECADNTQL